MYYLVRFQAYTPPSIQSPLLSYHVLLGKVPGLYPSQSPVLSYHVLLGMVPGLLYPSLKNPVAPAFLPCITWYGSWPTIPLPQSSHSCFLTMYYLVRFLAYTPPSIQSPLLSYRVLHGKVPGLYPSSTQSLPVFLPCITW